MKIDDRTTLKISFFGTWSFIPQHLGTWFLGTWYLIPIVACLACGSPASRTDTASSPLDDLQPRLLRPNSDDGAPLRLKLVRKLPLRHPENWTAGMRPKWACRPDGFLLFDRHSGQVARYDRRGGAEAVSRLRHLATDILDVTASSDHYRIYLGIAGRGVQVVEDDGRNLDQVRFVELRNILGFAAPPDAQERLPLKVLSAGGALLQVLDGGQRIQMHHDRTSADASQSASRFVLDPFLMAAQDEKGCFYSVETTDYTIRKYDPQGRYLGDFPPSGDPAYRPPPPLPHARPDDPRQSAQWMATWTPVTAMTVYDQWLVVALGGFGRQPERRHVYRLDGLRLADLEPIRGRLLGQCRGDLIFRAPAAAASETRLLIYRRPSP